MLRTAGLEVGGGKVWSPGSGITEMPGLVGAGALPRVGMPRRGFGTLGWVGPAWSLEAPVFQHDLSAPTSAVGDPSACSASEQGREGMREHVRLHLPNDKAKLIASCLWSLAWHAQLGQTLLSLAAASALFSGISALFVNQLNLRILV